MKKILSLCLAVLMLLSIFPMSIGAAATEMPAQLATDEDTSSSSVNLNVMPTDIAFTLTPPLASGEIRVIADCRVTQGETMLHITNATWYPAMDIEIGFRDQTTLQRYKVDFSNGSITDFGITTPNVPSGSYYIYIRNNGAMSIGSGTFYYEVTG